MGLMSLGGKAARKAWRASRFPREVATIAGTIVGPFGSLIAGVNHEDPKYKNAWIPGAIGTAAALSVGLPHVAVLYAILNGAAYYIGRDGNAYLKKESKNPKWRAK